VAHRAPWHTANCARLPPSSRWERRSRALSMHMRSSVASTQATPLCRQRGALQIPAATEGLITTQPTSAFGGRIPQASTWRR